MAIPPFDAQLLELPDDQLGIHLLAWWMAHEASTRGIHPRQIPTEMAENIRVATLTIDIVNVELIPLEKALRLAASGDMARAGQLFREHIISGAFHMAALDEVVTGSRRQRKNAKKPRIDGLQALVIEIMTDRADIKPSEMVEALRSHEGGEVIDAVNDEEGIIEWRDKNNPAGVAKISGLKDRMSRTRKYLSSR